MGVLTMTQEEKDLLLKDLCARLPYGVRYRHFAWDDERGEECIASQIYSINPDGYVKNYYDDETDYIDNVHPYLFPLSSMTEEQERELIALTGYKSECEAYCGFDSMGYYIKAVGEFEYEEGEHSFMFYPDYVGVDWFNKNHFDYRGLIEKGLAIDATGLNIY